VKPGEAAPLEETQAASGRTLGSPQAIASSGARAIGSSEGRAVLRNHRTGEIKVSPKARRMAAEKGVDLAAVRGSGPAGEILAADIEAAAGGVEITVALNETARTGASAAHQLSPIARLMAERTAQSWTTVPHFCVTRELDAGALNEARQALAAGIEKSHNVKLTHSDLLIALVARVLVKHVRMNASWMGDGIRENVEINISLAIAVNDGVVAPVIHNADRAALGTIAAARRDLAERARANKLRPADLAGGTFTISNLGMYEVDAFTAIITPPQAAILAVGRIADRVVALNSQAVVRPMLTVTLSVDHRVADGARAAEFLQDVAIAIADPPKWLEK
jgi:pyruvate dehydrogenase E2 component (dihydrolipoamide acetyltransferase)